MPKILHVTTVRPPFEVRVFHHECVSLAKAGYDVDLIVHAAEDITVDGVNIRSIGQKEEQRGLFFLSRLKAVLSVAREIRQTKRVGIIHLHDPELIPLGWWLKLTGKAKVIYDSAENYTAYMKQKYWFPAPVRWLLWIAMGTTESIAAKLFDAVITADEGTSEIFRERRAKRVVTLHNFPVLKLLNADVKDSDKEFDLVYHGSIPKYHLETSFAVAEELLKRNRKARWLFFGQFHDHEWANQEIEKRGLDGLFEIRGRVEHDEVAPLVAQARIGFIPLPDLPKFRQNIPMKMFEFMALKMPVVMSDLPPSRPFVGDGKCAIMVPPGDLTAYVDAIETLLDDDERRNEMGKEGQRRVVDEYNWTLESKKLFELYDELLPE